MGLFKSYQNSGSGISKYAPKKTGLALYWDLLGRRFWQVVGVNLLFFVFCLPLYVMIFAINSIDSYNTLITVLGVLLLIFAVFFGPAMAGMTKVLRSYVIQKRAYIIRDFFGAFKSNFKNACIVGILDVIAAAAAYSCLALYPRWAVAYGSKLFYIPMVISLAVFLLIFMMNFYLFLMMVATDLSLKNLIKNSFALAIASLKQNIIVLVTMLLFGIFMLTLLLVSLPVFMIVVPFFPAAFVWFTVCFTCYPQIQKYVINPYYDSMGETNPELIDEAEKVDAETLFEDMGGKEAPVVQEKSKKKGKKIS